ncbi:nucleotidyltransferase substrate binding protein [Synechococcus lacustris]|uniref:nucleotidyltransferase substrate binding protein n=1 Tax=Synechococcus TaxID=1129 RepID=UPI0020CBC464|nr:nucleotidyltransferase substrate binding protein [Synechococcus lacustris]MCP9795671.1 nucleotidyltransferase substrate binding protein [Synechococcus lacustris L1F-Slac]MCP9812210.1 nucleotidyltransferase substrate binding protein [Synechococcus lacustris Maggiore-St4-Slac]MCP9814910.1 nucleotidyltransferase substrate binding protein [Synechococcus lacustris L1E-Slac]MCP9923415.1 nucleotidyltransferase substrate binding protein [Synechococcus lacustris Cruz CV12-2]MCP9926048.1 nucleotidylt
MTNRDVRWLQRLENYCRALAALQRAIAIANQRALSELEEQGLIQAFEFTHELSWLLLKDYLADQGVSGISGSRDAVREAMVRELLPVGTEETWMAMIRSRNLTSHTYNPELAHEIASLIQQTYIFALTALQRELQARAERR